MMKHIFESFCIGAELSTFLMRLLSVSSVFYLVKWVSTLDILGELRCAVHCLC